MVLASQFNHVIHPFTVLLALPFSVFFRLYGVEFLSQFGGEYDLRALPVEQPQTAGNV